MRRSFGIEGPGAIECLQGLLTNDLVAAGEKSLSYGGMLTTKGMILLDPFVLRVESGVMLVLAGAAREIARQHFARVLPPRLAKASEHPDWAVAFLLGPLAESLLAAGIGESVLPAAGHTSGGPDDLLVSRGAAGMPFRFMVIGPAEQLRTLPARLEAGGAVRGDEASLAMARVLKGWPALGAEIDEKTLPQEVRYDELGAVSYSKGCYTGQETVARVHFRGHPNRSLRGAILPPGHIDADRKLLHDGKEVGVLRTTVKTADQTFALATVRREVAPDATLHTKSGEVRLVPFPVKEAVSA